MVLSDGILGEVCLGAADQDGGVSGNVGGICVASMANAGNFKACQLDSHVVRRFLTFWSISVDRQIPHSDCHWDVFGRDHDHDCEFVALSVFPRAMLASHGSERFASSAIIVRCFLCRALPSSKVSDS